MLLADAPTVIQVEWQALTAAAGIIGAALAGAAKILASQWGKNSDEVTKRHTENRQDALEARDENRVLSQAILKIQAETVKTLTALQREIEQVVRRLDRIEGHTPPTTQPPKG